MKADHEVVKRLLKTARGQIEGIIKMVDDDRYCIDIVNQVSAVSSVLKKTERVVLKAHMTSCVRNAMENNDENDKAVKISELVNLIDKI